MNKEFLKGHLPVLVLGLLDQKPMHGYAICEALSGDRDGKAQLDLGEGTIYPLLHRLERQGHVTALWQRGETGKMRKVYKLTKSGRAMIAAHRADFRDLATLFQKVFGKDWSTA
jgi:DNA-binding PadR family transcriptional regulator